MALTRNRAIIWLLAIGVILDLAIGVNLLFQYHAQQQLQRASTCWNRVLVVAVHDHLTQPQRDALTVEAYHCASLTK